MPVVSDDWIPRLVSALAVAIREFCTPLGGERVVCLDIGCFPWHGSIELSALTAVELEADPLMLSPREVASWRFYNFSDSVASWTQTAELGKRMSQAYYAADDDSRAAIAEAFMRACAIAATVPEVEAAFRSLPQDPRFRVRVVHPDSGQEFGPAA
ncbi:MAG: hypothetical protein SFU86_03015 [Pirellulaceae bacterium]|nr:hypothetical protein [Pirellulaceae bacterium]